MLQLFITEHTAFATGERWGGALPLFSRECALPWLPRKIHLRVDSTLTNFLFHPPKVHPHPTPIALNNTFHVISQ